MNKNLLIALVPGQSDPPEREHIAGKGWRLEWGLGGEAGDLGLPAHPLPRSGTPGKPLSLRPQFFSSTK